MILEVALSVDFATAQNSDLSRRGDQLVMPEELSRHAPGNLN